MSDDSISVVPRDPAYVPPPNRAEDARLLLAAIAPDAESVTATTFEQFALVHPIENFGRIFCLSCKTELTREWWEDAIEERAVGAEDVSAAGLTNLGVLAVLGSLEVETPCCATKTTFDQLDYETPVGFGRFVLEALNPNSSDLSPQQLEDLGTKAGTPLFQIRTHL